jgi:uncharacterized protein YebE (UPF0316 family)
MISSLSEEVIGEPELLMIQLALLIFVLRVMDVTAATMRVLMISRGRKLYVWFLAFIQAFIFIIAIRVVIAEISSLINILAFAGGYATGSVTGIWLEGKIAIGHVNMRIISAERGPELAEHLRREGFAVTEYPGRGKDGTVSVLDVTVLRREVKKVENLINLKDDKAFITAENIKSVSKGFWRR